MGAVKHAKFMVIGHCGWKMIVFDIYFELYLNLWVKASDVST